MEQSGPPPTGQPDRSGETGQPGRSGHSPAPPPDRTASLEPPGTLNQTAPPAEVSAGRPAADPAGRPVLAGILTALVGFTSSFAVVLAGLRGVGATPAEAASGLLVVCATQGVGILWLVRRHRIPLTLAWSTPGAAVLASTGAVRGGWPAAVGAFGVAGGLIVI